MDLVGAGSECGTSTIYEDVTLTVLGRGQLPTARPTLADYPLVSLCFRFRPGPMVSFLLLLLPADCIQFRAQIRSGRLVATFHIHKHQQQGLH